MKINKYFILESLNVIFVNLIVVYNDNPTKAIKKKLEEFLKSMPHLMYDESTQNKLFELITNNPIDSYNSNRDDLRDYLYYIYKEIAHFLNINPKKYNEFYETVYKEMTNDNKVLREIKYKYVNSILFILVLVSIIYIYMKYIA